MAKFDHLTLLVRDWTRSRDWYIQHIGLKVEFEIPQRFTAALQDQSGFTIFVEQSGNQTKPVGIALYFSVADVEIASRELSRAGAVFTHLPKKTYWGYGAELIDPDGYVVRLWDERSMKEKGDM